MHTDVRSLAYARLVNASGAFPVPPLNPLSFAEL